MTGGIGDQEQFRAGISWRESEQAIRGVFDDIDLNSYLPAGIVKPRVAILGAGPAVESGALDKHFTAHGFQQPDITAFDIDNVAKRLTEGHIGSSGVHVEYRIVDLTDDSSLGEEQYDLVIVRNPNSHSGRDSWEKIFENGFEHLRSEGVFLATSTEPTTHDFIRDQLQKRGDVVLEYTIPARFRMPAFFNESDLILAKKRQK